METKNLLNALLNAQKAVKGAPKDGTNEYLKYQYTTAEEIITICRKALADNGLVVFRSSWRWTPQTSEAPAGVECKMVLAHVTSGESLEYDYTFPAIPDKGRPMDKAVAAALTSSMGYWLRDLLLVPRGNELSMDNRDDRKYEPEPPPKKPATTPPAPKRPLPPPPDPANEDIPGLEGVHPKTAKETEAAEEAERIAALQRLETKMEVDGIGVEVIQRIALQYGMCKPKTEIDEFSKRALLGLVNNWDVVKKLAAKFAK